MKKIFLKAMSAIFIVFIAINSVNANEIVAADNEVVEEGNYDSVRLVAGNKVISKAIIDGISFAAGNQVSLEGSASYGFYAGNSIDIKGSINKDVFAAGNDIIVSSSAEILRDAYFAGNSISINANIGRDLRAGGMSVNLSGITIGRDAYIDADEIILDEKTVIEGVLSYSEDARVKGLNAAQVGSIVKRSLPEVNVKVNVRDTIYNLIISIIGSFIVMVVLFYFLPDTKEKLEKTDLSFGNILKTAGIGILVLMIVPIACIIALFTGVLLPLSLITIAIYVISIYLSKILVAYIIGNLINTKLFKNDNAYLALAIGIVLVRFLLLIPIIGGYIAIITLIYGLGLIYKYISKR